MKLLSSTRSRLWWNHLILPLTFWVYLSSIDVDDPIGSWLKVVHVLSAFVFLAVLGYMINDFFDKTADEKVGKSNFFTSRPAGFKLIIPMVATVDAVLWYLLNPSFMTIGLICIEVFFFIVYSMPPMRLKETAIGLPIDAAYSRVLPSLIALTLWPFWSMLNTWLIIVSGTWLFVIGLRNIFLHQVDDFENDKYAEVKTFAQRYDSNFLREITLKGLLPVEIILGVTALTFLSEFVNVMFLAYPIFGAFLIIRYNLWRKASWSKVQWKSMLPYILNDLYEGVLPLLLLVVLSVQNTWILLTVPVHILMFPKVFREFLEDGRIMKRNIISFVKYVSMRCRLSAGHLVNWLIYRFFLLFGVNLKEENLSAFGYFKKRFTK